jgi:hypothetical protein
MNLSSLDDRTLLAQTRQQAALEREATAKMLHYLREVHRRRLYSDLHYSSLFDFCLKELGWSEGQASRRITTARLIESKPRVEEMIVSGQMSLGVAAELGRFFKKEKLDEVTQDRLIEAVRGKSRRESDVIFSRASKNPISLKHESLRRHDPETQRLALNVSDQLVKKLERIRNLMGHKDVSSFENLINAMADVVLKKIDPSRKTEAKPERSSAFIAQVKRRKYIPAKIKREIRQAAGNRCEKCGGTHALEVDHAIPLIKGGDNSKENLRLLCRSCNQREAITKIGLEQMRPFVG